MIMTTSPDSTLAWKRKLQHSDSRHEPATKRYRFQGHDPYAPWLSDTKALAGCHSLGDRAVQHSLPLANMVTAVRDLIDPDFDPLTAILDDEPRFLKPLPDCIAPEDLEFLRFRGALSVPESGLRNELLRSYVQWVHSFMPVLNLQEFLRCIAENDPNGNVSILLFQAVMFVGTAFIDLKHLQDAGYSTRKSARNAFFTRLRLLYSFDCEKDRIVILQTVLLMTYWSDPENSPQRDIWDWIGICNTQAHSIGLNNDPSAATDMDLKTRRLRTRLWWCLYSRDRLIAMGMRRPLQVNEGMSNVPMLKSEDFDFEPFSPSAVALFHCRQLEDVSHQKRLATMFIEKVKLCQCIGRVLFAQYAPSQRHLGATDYTTVTLIPRQASESEFIRCNQKLDSWLSALPKEAHFIPASKSNYRDGEDVLLLHGAMLRMLYHATTSALHRPWAAHTKDQPKSHVEWRDAARAKMHDAATGITHIVQGLNQLNLTRFLPQSGVTVILPAAVAHLSNSLSDNPAVRESSVHNFRRCIHVLHCLKDIYPAANVEFANLEAAIKTQSRNYKSNTFSQIMQYDFDGDATLAVTGEHCSTDSFLSIDLSRHSEDKFASRAQASNLRPRAASMYERSTREKSNSITDIPRKGSYTAPHITTRSFPNDFDNHFAALNDSISDKNLFDYLSIDFENFPNMVDFPNRKPNDLSISDKHPDNNDVDWTQALFWGTSPAELDNPNRPEGQGCTQGLENNQHTDNEQEQDLFSFTLKDSEDEVPHQRHSTNNRGDITGDLDRDLGFQDGDEMF